MDSERRGSEGFVEQTLLIHDPNYGSNILALLNDLRSQVTIIIPLRGCNIVSYMLIKILKILPFLYAIVRSYYCVCSLKSVDSKLPVCDQSLVRLRAVLRNQGRLHTKTVPKIPSTGAQDN